MIGHGIGVAAMDETGNLLGYLGFYGPIERFFGSATGAYAPLHGYAASGDNRERLIELLVQHAAERLVDREITSLAITMYAHDGDAYRALTLTGFGIRNSDAIRDIHSPISAPPVPGYHYTEISGEDVLRILPLENGLIQHLRSSPVFLQVSEHTTDVFLKERVEGSRFFVARAGDELVGYLKVSDEGESFFTRVPGMPNISGAYLFPEHRGRGVYDALLAHVIDTLRDEGNRLLGVDFETMNPTARHFWNKYFEPYTYSYARRIDEGSPGKDS
jgi:GNAT superfamily N-acetyltransferase